MQTLIRKLSSRKLWTAILGIAAGLAAAFGLDQNELSQIAGLVTSCVSAAAYIFCEAAVDISRKNNAKETETK